VSTEAGMESLEHARRDIEVLRDRLVYLEQWSAEREAVTGVPDTGVRAQEARAIRWALPILEAEWDAMLRIKRDAILPAMHPKDGRDLRAELAVAQ
jgi:hypothetical protein